MRKVVTALVVGALLAAGPALAQAKSGKGSGYEQLNLFSEAYDRIRQDAVEPVGEGKLIGAAIAGMLSGLDARSAYINEAAYRAMQTPANDDQASLGLVVTIENGQLKVIAPQDGSPAAQAGIKPGDLIYAIDKDPTYDLTLGEAEQKLRGPAGSEVELSLRRDNHGPIDVTVKRERYKLQAVTARIEAGNILYLRVAGFDPGTPAALTSAVQDLRQRAGNKVIGFILDLRNNPGGAFEAAVAVADAFIDKGDIAVVKGRKPGSLKRISATPGDIAQGLPIVALINGGTATGSGACRRRVAGQSAGGAGRDEKLWRELDRKPDPAPGKRCHPPHHRPVPDAERPKNSGQGSHSRSHCNARQAGETSPGVPPARGRSARRSEEYRPGVRGRQGCRRQGCGRQGVGSLARDCRHWLGG